MLMFVCTELKDKAAAETVEDDKTFSGQRALNTCVSSEAQQLCEDRG